MKKKTVKVRNMEIGAGIPKICIPLVADGPEELKTALGNLKGAPCDLVEFRADFYENIEDADTRTEALQMIRSFLGDIPLLFTFRTAAEGGNRAIADQDYFGLNAAAAASGLTDIVDVETGRGEELVSRLVQTIHSSGILALGSNHDFEKTPPEDEIIRRLCRMQELNLDITKIAVMPRCRQDVLRLMSAAVKMEEIYADRPCVTMSMGRTGVISRVTGSFSGSAITFGTAGKASAPGQIPSADMNTVLQILSESIG